VAALFMVRHLEREWRTGRHLVLGGALRIEGATGRGHLMLGHEPRLLTTGIEMQRAGTYDAAFGPGNNLEKRARYRGRIHVPQEMVAQNTPEMVTPFHRPMDREVQSLHDRLIPLNRLTSDRRRMRQMPASRLSRPALLELGPMRVDDATGVRNRLQADG
jgi:hypothetical protein